MGLFDFLRSKKKRKKKAAQSEAEGAMRLDGVDLSGVEPTETRYTQEYQDYLAKQEAERTGPQYPAVSPEGFCAGFERCASSLIEEPEHCEVCVFFSEGDSTCRRPEKVQ